MAIQFACPTCGKQLKADESAVGKRVKCPGCQGIAEVPGAGGGIPLAPVPAPAPAAEEGGGNRRPCPMCGEMILADAAKCRFCGEIFDPELKRLEKRKRGAEDDADMTTGDWLVAILCSGIGCIMGLIWLIQGKPKGGKMFGISLAMVVFWNVVNFILQAAIKR